MDDIFIADKSIADKTANKTTGSGDTSGDGFDSASVEAIDRAVRILRQGGLVAFPTETVYGLGADARNSDAVRRIFAAKGRPADHPVIVHLADAEQLDRWASNVPDVARSLADAFWPGPLTLILPRHDTVADVVTGGQPTVGVRVPSHPLALALLRRFEGGIAAPSANRFGRISPTRAEHVRAELGDRVDMILDGGPAEVGVESTIVDLSRGVPRVLRPGGVSVAQLREVLGDEVFGDRVGVGSALEQKQRDNVRAPGTLASHYAPRTRTVLVGEGGLEPYLSRHPDACVLARHPQPAHLGVALWRALPDDPTAYARELYAALRDLDTSACELIIVEAVSDDPAWLAVRDRLRRATTPSSTPPSTPSPEPHPTTLEDTP